MKSDPAQLARLIEVLDASFQAKQARMGEIGRRIDATMERLRALDPKPQTHEESELDLAMRTGADMRWRAWAEARRKALNVELARLYQEKEARRTDLSQAFGKLRAAEAMSAKVQLDADRIKNRRDW